MGGSRRRWAAVLVCGALASGVSSAEVHARGYFSEWHGCVVPRFLDCEGPSWSPAWSRFRQKLQEEPPGELLREGRSPGLAVVRLAEDLGRIADGAELGYHLFARRAARDLGFNHNVRPWETGHAGTYDSQTAGEDGFVADDALGGFCLYGLVAALFVQAVSLLAGPSLLSKQVQEQAVDHTKMALALIGPSLSLDFLESSSWPVRSLDMRALVERAGRTTEEAGGMAPWRTKIVLPDELSPPESHHLAIAMSRPAHPVVTQLPGAELSALSLLAGAKVLAAVRHEAGGAFDIAGIGDHATGTLDAALMVQRALQAAAGLAGDGDVAVHTSLHGLACPAEEVGRHHCRLRCQVLGVCHATLDPLAEWIMEHILHDGDHGSLIMDKATTLALSTALAKIPEVTSANLLVCAHPTAVCLLAFDTMMGWRQVVGVPSPPMLVHASSTLLYGAPGCEVCSGALRRFTSQAALDYLRLTKELLSGAYPIVMLAEGAVLSAQLQKQVGITVPSCPAMALYLERTSYLGNGGSDGSTGGSVQPDSKRLTVLVTRARFFSRPSGLLLKSLLGEFAILRDPVADASRGHFWFPENLGEDSSGEAGSGGTSDSWKSWEEMSQCQAAFFVPSDMHQRTFIELYRMHVPTFMPGPEWLAKIPLMAPFGTFAYDGVLPLEELPEGSAQTQAGEAAAFFDAAIAPAETMLHWYQYSDYAHYPHVFRCTSVPDVLSKLASADLEDTARRMREHYGLLARGATAVFSRALAELLL